MTKLRLYSRPDCHLCEYALVLLDESGCTVELETVDIETQAELLERYDITIPVFQRMDTGAELFWPFDDDELEEFLA
jgi:glutaredoxin